MARKVRRKKRSGAAHRRSRTDAVVIGTMQDNAHRDTLSMVRRRNVLGFLISTNESEITELSARLSELRKHNTNHRAEVLGIEKTITKR